MVGIKLLYCYYVKNMKYILKVGLYMFYVVDCSIMCDMFYELVAIEYIMVWLFYELVAIEYIVVGGLGEVVYKKRCLTPFQIAVLKSAVIL